MKTLVLVLLCLCLCNCVVAARIVGDAQPIEVPFTLQNGAVLVVAKIKGKGPFNFVLATGSPESYLSRQVQAEFEYQIQPSYDLAQKRLNFVDVPEIEIGDLKVNSFAMKPENLRSQSRELNVTLHGVLGYDFLKKLTVQIDYKKKVVRFSSTKFPKANPPASQSAQTIMQMELPMEYPVPVIKDILVNGQKLKAVVDTWQQLPLCLTPAAAKYLNLPLPVDKKPTQIKTVESLQVGGVRQDKVTTLFYNSGNNLDHGLNKYGAILGAGFLSNHVVTFDYQNKQIIFE